MGRTVGIGIQSFEKLIENHYFYIDKTNFIKEWWENGDNIKLTKTYTNISIYDTMCL